MNNQQQFPWLDFQQAVRSSLEPTTCQDLELFAEKSQTQAQIIPYGGDTVKVLGGVSKQAHGCALGNFWFL